MVILFIGNTEKNVCIWRIFVQRNTNPTNKATTLIILNNKISFEEFLLLKKIKRVLNNERKKPANNVKNKNQINSVENPTKKNPIIEINSIKL